jgi:hypothetical protein
VQIVLTLAVLLALPSPLGSSTPLIALAALAVTLAVVLVLRARSGRTRAALSRLRHTAVGDVRPGLLGARAWIGIAAVSALGVAGHAITFLIAAKTAGTTASLSEMLPLALLVMMAMVLPSAGGWGPREGVTAWAFGAAGLGAQRGVATAVVFGVMVFVASLPGAAVLCAAWFRRTRPAKLPQRTPRRPLREGTAHA